MFFIILLFYLSCLYDSFCCTFQESQEFQYKEKKEIDLKELLLHHDDTNMMSRRSLQSSIDNYIFGTFQIDDNEDSKLADNNDLRNRNITNIPYSEWLALEDFYYSLNGSNWNIQNQNCSRWNFSSYNNNNPCLDKWAGIVCTCFHYKRNYYSYGYYNYYYTSSIISGECHIEKLVLNGYNLVGTLPSSIGNFSYLKRLLLSYNRINGTIPSEFKYLSNLLHLGLYKNQLIGTIPSSLGQLTNLEYLVLSYNQLIGPIPNFFGQLRNLSSCSLFSNLLVGTIPSSLGQLTNLSYLYLGYNQLEGTIPSILGNLTNLRLIDLQYNSLYGTIPSCLGNLTKLRYLYFQHNQLFGTIPPALGNMTRLQLLYLSYNLFTGTIPLHLGYLTNLKYLDLSYNQLVGTIPLYDEIFPNLKSIVLSNNMLTGIIPSAIGKLQHLQEILLYSNMLQGSISDLFNSSLQLQLQSIMFDSNSLTGTIPSNIFELKNLTTFRISINCLTGSIPYSAICNSSTLQNLLLDGLQLSTSCTTPLHLFSFPLIYIQNPNLNFGYDSCVFSIPTIKNLHLSSNGIVGSLPSNLTLADNLTEVFLSHNQLSGSLPISMQSRVWSNLDLSYNRINGILDSGFTNQLPDSSISLEQNRLSGRIPTSIIAMTNNINILSGNLFSCNRLLNDDSLPRNDPDYNTYVCGSFAFTIPYFLWLCLLTVVVVFIVVIVYYNNINNKRKETIFQVFYASIKKVLKQFSIKRKHQDKLNKDIIKYYYDIETMKAKLRRLLRFCITLTFYISTILLLIYVINGINFNIYEDEYGWITSIGFKSGPIAFLLSFLALFVLVWILLLLIVRKRMKIKQPHSFLGDSLTSNRNTNSLKKASKCLSSITWIVAPIINVAVVAGANFGYVYAYLNTPVSALQITIIQIALGMFKSFWNGVGYRYLSRFVNGYFDVDYLAVNHSLLQLFIRLLNNIIIPCIVILAINPSCFYNLFYNAEPVSSQFEFKVCSGVNQHTGACIYSPVPPVPTSFYPPFSYSYQCSSQFLVAYTPTFIFMCIFDGILFPIAQFFCLLLYNHGISNNNQCLTCFSKVLPIILKINELDSDDNSDRVITPDILHPYFDSLQIYLNIFSYLGLIMTYGAVFPPLGVSFFVTLYTINFIYIYKVNRFVNYAIGKGKLNYVEVINKECEGFLDGNVIIGSVWMIIVFSCNFYSLFLFDILGSSEGLNGSYWVLIVMPLIPLFDYIIYIIIIWFFFSSVKSNISESQLRLSELDMVIVENPIKRDRNESEESKRSATNIDNYA